MKGNRSSVLKTCSITTGAANKHGKASQIKSRKYKALIYEKQLMRMVIKDECINASIFKAEIRDSSTFGLGITTGQLTHGLLNEAFGTNCHAYYSFHQATLHF